MSVVYGAVEPVQSPAADDVHWLFTAINDDRELAGPVLCGLTPQGADGLSEYWSDEGPDWPVPLANLCIQCTQALANLWPIGREGGA